MNYAAALVQFYCLRKAWVISHQDDAKLIRVELVQKKVTVTVFQRTYLSTKSIGIYVDLSPKNGVCSSRMPAKIFVTSFDIFD